MPNLDSADTVLASEYGSFSGLDPSSSAKSLNWSDQDVHSRVINVLMYYLQESASFRTKVVNDIKRLARYQANLMLKAEDSVSAEASNRASMAEKQARDKGKRRAFSVPVMIGAAERRKALYGALPLDFECSRMTTCDDDYTIAEYMSDLSKRFLSAELEQAKWIYMDKLVWEYRPVLKVEWDSTGGVLSQAPILTDDEFTKYKAGRVRNKKVGDGFWRRDEGNNLMRTPPVPTGIPRFCPLGPLDYLIDPACGHRGVRGARHFADQRIVDASEVFSEWANDSTELGKKAARILQNGGWGGWNANLTITQAESEIWALRGLRPSGTTQTKAVLTEAFFRPRPGLGLPEGLHCLFLASGGIDSGTFNSGVVLRYEPLRWPYDIPAYDDGVEIVTSRYYYGDLNTNLSGGLNRGLNQLFSSAVYNASRLGKRVSYATGVDQAPGGPSLRDGIQEITSDETLVVLPGNASIVQSDRSGSAAQIQMSFLAPFIEAMNISTNSGAGGMPTGEAVGIAQRGMMYEASVANAVKERAAATFTGAMLLGMRMCQRFHSVDDLQAILPDKDPTETILFRDADLTHNTSVALRQASFFAGNMEARLSVVAMAAQGKDLFEKYVPGDQLRELLNLRDSLGTTAEDDEVERAEKENGMLRRGPIVRNDHGKMVEIPFQGVMETDDHPAHIRTHLKILRDPNRESLSVDYLSRVLLHVNQHFKFEAAMQQVAMTNAFAAQAASQDKVTALGGPPAEGQPPPGPGQGAAQ